MRALVFTSAAQEINMHNKTITGFGFRIIAIIIKPEERIFYISFVFLNARRVSSQCNTRVGLFICYSELNKEFPTISLVQRFLL